MHKPYLNQLPTRSTSVKLKEGGEEDAEDEEEEGQTLVKSLHKTQGEDFESHD